MEWQFQDTFVWLAWTGLDEVEIWSIVTCWRSCDEAPFRDNWAFKEATVGRIRKCSVVGFEDYWNFWPGPLTEEQIESRNRLLLKVSDHFYTHFKSAARALTRVGLMPSCEQFI